MGPEGDFHALHRSHQQFPEIDTLSVVPISHGEGAHTAAFHYQTGLSQLEVVQEICPGPNTVAKSDPLHEHRIFQCD